MTLFMGANSNEGRKHLFLPWVEREEKNEKYASSTSWILKMHLFCFISLFSVSGFYPFFHTPSSYLNCSRRRRQSTLDESLWRTEMSKVERRTSSSSAWLTRPAARRLAFAWLWSSAVTSGRRKDLSARSVGPTTFVQPRKRSKQKEKKKILLHWERREDCSALLSYIQGATYAPLASHCTHYSHWTLEMETWKSPSYYKVKGKKVSLIGL